MGPYYTCTKQNKYIAHINDDEEEPPTNTDERLDFYLRSQTQTHNHKNVKNDNNQLWSAQRFKWFIGFPMGTSERYLNRCFCAYNMILTENFYTSFLAIKNTMLHVDKV